MTEYHDDVKRLHDGVALHFMADTEQATNSWVSVRLDNGRVGDDLFDTRDDAIRVTRQHGNEHDYFFIKLPPTGMSLKEAEAVLRMNREFAKAGMRLSDPDKEPVMPIQDEHLTAGNRLVVNSGSRAQLLAMIPQIEALMPTMPREDRRWWERELRRVRGLIDG